MTLELSVSCKGNPPILREVATTNAMPCFEDIPSDLLSETIMPFVGDYQYRFVGMVNHAFRNAYVAKFPRKRTWYNASTVEHTNICYEESDRTVALIILCPLIASKGDLDMLKYLRQLDISAHGSVNGRFGRSPRQWFRKQEPPPDRGMTCAVAAGGGHLKVLQWCQYNGFLWNASTYRAAIHFSQFEVLEWCQNSDCPSDEDNSEEDDVVMGQEQCSVLKWCRDNECLWDKALCVEAARNGEFGLLKFLRNNQEQLWDATACATTGLNHHFDNLEWCHASGCFWDERTCAAAAQNGHFEILKWFHENGCLWDEEVCEHAAGNGRLDMLQWCRARDCPWDEQCCVAAAQSGHLDVLIWCLDNGCPWYIRTCCIAAQQNGHLAVVQWCVDKGCPNTDLYCKG